MDFWKSFDAIYETQGLFHKLHDIRILETRLATIMKHYELVLSHLYTTYDLSTFTQSIFGVKKCCPISSTLLGIHIYEVESFSPRT